MTRGCRSGRRRSWRGMYGGRTKGQFVPRDERTYPASRIGRRRYWIFAGSATAAAAFPGAWRCSPTMRLLSFRAVIIFTIDFGIRAAPFKIDRPDLMVRAIFDAWGRSPICRQSSCPSLGGEAGGRSPGFISMSNAEQRQEGATLAVPFSFLAC
jgi:hypothetical protein